MDYYIEMVKNAWKWKKWLHCFELIINILKIFWEYFWTYKHKCQKIYFKMMYCRNQWDLNQMSYGVILCCGQEKTYCRRDRFDKCMNESGFSFIQHFSELNQERKPQRIWWALSVGPLRIRNHSSTDESSKNPRSPQTPFPPPGSSNDSCQGAKPRRA